MVTSKMAQGLAVNNKLGMTGPDGEAPKTGMDSKGNLEAAPELEVAPNPKGDTLPDAPMTDSTETEMSPQKKLNMIAGFYNSRPPTA